MTNKKPKPPSYTRAPVLDPKQSELYELALAVLSHQLSVSEAARRAGMPRVRFQTWLHRAQEGLIGGLTPRVTGRPPKPPPPKELEAEYRRLQQKNEALQARLAKQSEIIVAASALIQEQLGRGGRRGKRVRRRKTAGSNEEADGVRPGRLEPLEQVARLRRAGLRPGLVATLVGRSESTLRRWSARSRRGLSVIARRGPARQRPLRERDPDQAERLEELVRQSRGQLGAEALRRGLPGVSRRDAGALKATVLTALERERKAAAGHVRVTVAGVVRGFDAMHCPTSTGMRYALCAGDSAVPYTTSVAVAEHYDGASVKRALVADFEQNGVPLVLRLDRHSSHRCPEVRGLLDALGVLVLHGPPQHPRFYGQLERQNRDRRAWLDSCECLSPAELVSELERCRVILNSTWRRRTLGWCTAEECWRVRPIFSVDRSALRAEVAERDARWRERLAQQPEGVRAELAWRLAVADTLTSHDWLRLESRGGCYGVSTSISAH